MAKALAKLAAVSRAPGKSHRDFLGLEDLKDEVVQVLDLAAELKAAHKTGRETPLLKGRTLGMIFEKPSTRTRVSFEVGMTKLGGHAVHMSPRDLQLGRGETIQDTALALSRYVDILVYRAFRSSDVHELARHAPVPVINGLDDEEHPCQILADLLTMREQRGALRGLRVAFVGDGDNNVAHSLLLGCAAVGARFVCASPRGYAPSAPYLEKASAIARASGGSLAVVRGPQDAVRGADCVVTDTWVSMGDETEKRKRLRAFRGYTVNAALMAQAKPDAVFLHCLPAYYGHEVTRDVAHGPQSVMWDEAENRMWVQMAVMCRLLGVR